MKEKGMRSRAIMVNPKVPSQPTASRITTTSHGSIYWKISTHVIWVKNEKKAEKKGENSEENERTVKEK
jgi:hypothetical protein